MGHNDPTAGTADATNRPFLFRVDQPDSSDLLGTILRTEEGNIEISPNIKPLLDYLQAGMMGNVLNRL